MSFSLMSPTPLGALILTSIFLHLSSRASLVDLKPSTYWLFNSLPRPSRKGASWVSASAWYSEPPVYLVKVFVTGSAREVDLFAACDLQDVVTGVLAGVGGKDDIDGNIKLLGVFLKRASRLTARCFEAVGKDEHHLSRSNAVLRQARHVTGHCIENSIGAEGHFLDNELVLRIPLMPEILDGLTNFDRDEVCASALESAEREDEINIDGRILLVEGAHGLLDVVLEENKVILFEAGDRHVLRSRTPTGM